MSDLEALRARVAAAQESLSQTGDQRRQQSAQLAALIGNVEAALAQKQSEVAAFEASIAALRDENAQLRGLLESLTGAIEATSQDEVRSAVAGLDSALAAITGAAAAPEESTDESAAEEDDDLALEMVDEIDDDAAQESSGVTSDDAATNDAIAEVEMEPVVPGGGPDDGLLADIEAAAAEGGASPDAEDVPATADDGDEGLGMIVEAALDDLEIEAAPEGDAVIEAEAGGIEITPEGTVEAAEVESPADASEQPAATGEGSDDPDAVELPPGDPARVKEIIDRVSRLADEMSSVAATDSPEAAADEAESAAETAAPEARAAQV